MVARRYRLVVEGRLEPAAREAFVPLDMSEEPDRTTMTGRMDQAALFGYLRRVASLSLVLTAVERLEDIARPAALHTTPE